MLKLSILSAAVAAAMALPLATAPAAAQHHRTEVRHTTVKRSYHRPARHRTAWRTVCTNRWRNHHRVRVCRKVRYSR